MGVLGAGTWATPSFTSPSVPGPTDAPTHAALADDRRAVALLDDGTMTRGELSQLSDEGLVLVESEADQRTIRWARCAGVILGHDPGVASTTGGVIMLADGQRLPGRAEMNASGWRWWQPWLGVMETPPSNLRWVSFDGAAPPSPSPDADVLLLRTGDRLEGFVTRIADPLSIEPRSGGEPMMIPAASIASIAFVAADPGAKERRRRVWLRDGTVLDARSMRFDGGDLLMLEGLAIEGAPAGVTVPINRVAGIAGDGPSRPLALGDVRTVETPQGSELRYVTTPPERLLWPDRRAERRSLEDREGLDASAWPFHAPSIAFDGPAILRVTIEEPAQLCARLRLPRDRRPWGRFDLLVRSGGTVLARASFDASSHTHLICVPVEPPAVEFEIVDTGGGAVQDGVVIEHGVLIGGPWDRASSRRDAGVPPTSP